MHRHRSHGSLTTMQNVWKDLKQSSKIYLTANRVHRLNAGLASDWAKRHRLHWNRAVFRNGRIVKKCDHLNCIRRQPRWIRWHKIVLSYRNSPTSIRFCRIWSLNITSVSSTLAGTRLPKHLNLTYGTHPVRSFVSCRRFCWTWNRYWDVHPSDRQGFDWRFGHHCIRCTQTFVDGHQRIESSIIEYFFGRARCGTSFKHRRLVMFRSADAALAIGHAFNSISSSIRYQIQLNNHICRRHRRRAHPHAHRTPRNSIIEHID